MASSRMPRLKLGGQRVPEPVRVDARDAGGTADPEPGASSRPVWRVRLDANGWHSSA
jgi:hypothetical protein